LYGERNSSFDDHPRDGVLMETLPVLMYHQIWPDGAYVPSDFVVAKSVFRHQMQYLAENGFTTPSAAELLERNGASAGKKRVLITFDDGYRNNAEQALPVLKEFGFRGVISLVGDRTLTTNLWDAHKGIPAGDLMSREEILAVDAEGVVEFASHSYGHKSLPGLNDEQLEEELVGSKLQLESLLGHPVTLFTYPYGDLNERVKQAVQRAGYRCAFAVHSGPMDFFGDLFEIRRVIIKNRDDEPYLFAKFSGLDRTVMWGKWFAKKLLGKHNTFQFEMSQHPPKNTNDQHSQS
jgi:peptidoglycan/xylan/chitin deacetylase (PgdA/CDA1 family)